MTCDVQYLGMDQVTWVQQYAPVILSHLKDCLLKAQDDVLSNTTNLVIPKIKLNNPNQPIIMNEEYALVFWLI